VCTGDVVNWLCGDDTLNPGALHIVGRHFAEARDLDVLVGGCHVTYRREGNRNRLWTTTIDIISLMPCCNPIPQSSCFFRRMLLDRSAPLDPSYHYAMDMELWNYFRSRNTKWKCISDILSTYPMTDSNKTSIGGSKIVQEMDRIYRSYTCEKIPLTFWYLRLRFPVQRFATRRKSYVRRLLARATTKIYSFILGPIYGHDRVKIMNWNWIRFPSDEPIGLSH
jgi:hypothetical protein